MRAGSCACASVEHATDASDTRGPTGHQLLAHGPHAGTQRSGTWRRLSQCATVMGNDRQSRSDESRCASLMSTPFLSRVSRYCFQPFSTLTAGPSLGNSGSWMNFLPRFHRKVPLMRPSARLSSICALAIALRAACLSHWLPLRASAMFFFSVTFGRAQIEHGPF